MSDNVLDRAIGAVSPRWRLRREQARIALDALQRNYEAASQRPRAQSWKRTTADANVAQGASLGTLRNLARNLERNNPWAVGGILDTIEADAIGWGIVPTEKHEAFRRWANSTACDADERLDFAGIQKLVLRSVARDGEVLVRRRMRRIGDGLPLPLQLQVLEADYLDTAKDAPSLPNGGEIIQGVEFDPLGRRAAYWLFRDHPGSTRGMGASSKRVPASEILHVFKLQRARQARAASWFAPVIAKLHDFDRYDDATLMKQLIAACLAIATTDVDGSAPSLGTVDPAAPMIDSLQPGGVYHMPVGRDVKVIEPPRVNEYGAYSVTQIRAITRPFGVTYEAASGDFSQVNFSSARMARLGYASRIEDWRWRMLRPLLLDPVWAWAMDAALFAGEPVVPTTEWTAPALPMVDPGAESMADQRMIRSGLKSLSETLRERGYQPRAVLQEYAETNKLLDELGLVLDSDPRKTSAQGLTQATPASEPSEPTKPDAPGDEEDDADEADDDDDAQAGDDDGE
jgi:lambda family phage portal protein